MTISVGGKKSLLDYFHSIHYDEMCIWSLASDNFESCLFFPKGPRNAIVQLFELLFVTMLFPLTAVAHV